MTADRDRLRDILMAIDDASLIVQQGRAALDTDPLALRAAKNIVTEIGEAAKAISTATTTQLDDVPWRAMAGMRDRTVHRYPEVDLDVLWHTLDHELPELSRQIRQHLRSSDEG